MGNQYGDNYQRLRDFVEATIKQVDSLVSHAVGYDRTTEKRDREER